MTNQPSNANESVAKSMKLQIIKVPKQDFGRWMKAELECLEKRFEDFQTAKSRRGYFSR